MKNTPSAALWSRRRKLMLANPESKKLPQKAMKTAFPNAQPAGYELDEKLDRIAARLDEEKAEREREKQIQQFSDKWESQ
jgi:ketopantoate reductase